MSHHTLREPATGGPASDDNVLRARTEEANPSAGGIAGKALFNPEMASQSFDMRGHGVFQRILDVPAFKGAYAMVLGSVTEYSRATDKPVMGDAVVTLHNLVSMDRGQVGVRVGVNWHEDLDIRVTLLWFIT
ncbi:hypothetical protein ABZ621_31675 [Streptomyces sp. NPDC007863]|uniref:hypothetical protein n=1 Tax=Streptomyces sp. NPDC007863 TaxID=3154894 RepID=UPI0033D15478